MLTPCLADVDAASNISVYQEYLTFRCTCSHSLQASLYQIIVVQLRVEHRVRCSASIASCSVCARQSGCGPL